MRKDQIISKMKAPTGPVGSGKRRRASLTLPFTALNYHFSQRYIYTFLSRYPVEIFYQAYTLLLNFYQCWREDKEENDGRKSRSPAPPELHPSFASWDTGGSCALVVSLMALEKIDFDVEIPEQIIVVDTNTMKSDVVRRGKLIKPMGGRKTASDEEDDQLLEEHFGDSATTTSPTATSAATTAEVAKTANADNVEDTTANAQEGSSDGQSLQALRSTKVRFADPDHVASTSTSEPLTKAPSSMESDGTHVIDIPARQASRINLALARNMSFRDINIREINPQDNIVVNACAVKISPNKFALSLDDIEDCDVINCQLRKKKNKGALPVLTSAPMSHLKGGLVCISVL